jgi:PAS domain S-box-containing protein
LASTPEDRSIRAGARDGPAQRASAEDRLRAVLELTTSFAFVAHVRADAYVELEWISDGFVATFGYTAEEIASLGGPAAIVHADDVDRAAAVTRALVAGDRPSDQIRLVGKDGRARWVRFHYVIDRGPDPDGALRLFGVGQDVTDESEAKAASVRDRDRLQAAFDHSPIGQVIVSRDQILLAVNPAFCQLTGYTAE